MAANPQSPLMSSPVYEQSHTYYAKAFLLEGELEHPVQRKIENYGHIVLEHTRRESLITRSVGETNIEGLISFKRGHTRVAGAHVNQKTDIFGQDHGGWLTLATSALEGYNVEDIFTVDRLVAQLSTQHPQIDGHVPRVNFIGTRFENLRIGGYPVEVELDLAFCGPRPQGGRTYLQDGDFLDRVHRQVDHILESDDLPDSLEEKYSAEVTSIDELKRRAKDAAKAGASANGSEYSKLRCSLVKKIKLPVEIPGVRTFGNAIFIRDFGTVYLAELEVGTKNGHSESWRRHSEPPRTEPNNSNYFSLTMVDIQMGCPATGNPAGGGVSGNGTTHP